MDNANEACECMEVVAEGQATIGALKNRSFSFSLNAPSDLRSAAAVRVKQSNKSTFESAGANKRHPGNGSE